MKNRADIAAVDSTMPFDGDDREGREAWWREEQHVDYDDLLEWMEARADYLLAEISRAAIATGSPSRAIRAGLMASLDLGLMVGTRLATGDHD